jgi:hypothetical protein
VGHIEPLRLRVTPLFPAILQVVLIALIIIDEGKLVLSGSKGNTSKTLVSTKGPNRQIQGDSVPIWPSYGKGLSQGIRSEFSITRDFNPVESLAKPGSWTGTVEADTTLSNTGRGREDNYRCVHPNWLPTAKVSNALNWIVPPRGALPVTALTREVWPPLHSGMRGI